MRWLPQSIFWRLFTATVGVVGVTLLMVVLLVMHERRELAFNESGGAAAVTSIADVSARLAKLPSAERAREIAALQTRPLTIAGRQLRRLPPDRDESDAQQRFARQVARQLGKGFTVEAGPPRAPPDSVILVLNEREIWPPFADPRERRERDGPPDRGPPLRMFDLNVTLPDGGRVVFRTPILHGGPPFPRTLLLELGVLTVLLGIVLFAMTRTITRPLQALARAADAVGRGTSTPPLREHGALEIRRATRAFNAMQERLQRYLDSRTRVLAAMSHDLRTPLTRLRLRVESIEDEALRQRCAEDVDEMARMVSGALSVFRGLNDEEQPTAIDVNGLLEGLARQYTETGHRVTVEGRAHAPLTGKPLALKRALSNLIDNAVQYGTCVQLQVDDGAQLVIRVLDDGPGIPAENLERVFEPFFRLESSRNRATGGTGLGLSIARDIAQAHGGTLTLDNRAAGGLAAVLTLPRKLEELTGHG